MTSDSDGATLSGYGAIDPRSWPETGLTMANLGHATLLINYFGVRVISDPTLFMRVGFSLASRLTIGPRRLVEPPLSAERLGPLDLILITHAHMDHLDLASLAALPKNAVVVAGHGCRGLIGRLGFHEVRELRWDERTAVRGLTITAMGARHWGRRWPAFGRDYGFNSYLLETNGQRMLLACDSAETDLFGTLASAPPAVAAFSIGAYDPFITSHANPEQVWRMFESTRASWLAPLHWGTFKLSREPMDEPLARLVAAAGTRASQIVMRRIGVSWKMPADIGTQPAAVPTQAPRLGE